MSSTQVNRASYPQISEVIRLKPSIITFFQEANLGPQIEASFHDSGSGLIPSGWNSIPNTRLQDSLRDFLYLKNPLLGMCTLNTVRRLLDLHYYYEMNNCNYRNEASPLMKKHIQDLPSGLMDLNELCKDPNDGFWGDRILLPQDYPREDLNRVENLVDAAFQELDIC